jgi:hypothetical protein
MLKDSNEGCVNLWVGDCEFYYGVDGNFDNYNFILYVWR